jgi:hypothetical protein
MNDVIKPEEDVANHDEQEGAEQQERKSRRDFLRRLGRWSAIIIGSAALGGMIESPEADAAGWVNRGGSWVNARGGGGGGWVNRAGGGGGGWINRGGGGGGGSWINRRG